MEKLLKEVGSVKPELSVGYQRQLFPSMDCVQAQ